MDSTARQHEAQSPSTFPSMSDAASTEPTSTQVITADMALQHIVDKEAIILSTLGKCNIHGSYAIQVGINEEVLRIGQGILEEIYIYIDFDIPSELMSVIDQLASICYPFMAILHTPSTSHPIPYASRPGDSPAEGEVEMLMRSLAVLRPIPKTRDPMPASHLNASTASQKEYEPPKVSQPVIQASTLHSQEFNDTPSQSKDGIAGGMGGDSNDNGNDNEGSDDDGDVGGRGGRGSGGGDDEGRGGGQDGSKGGSGGNSGNGRAGGGILDRRVKRPRVISVPFKATVTTNTDGDQGRTQQLTTSGSITVKVSQFTCA